MEESVSWGGPRRRPLGLERGEGGVGADVSAEVIRVRHGGPWGPREGAAFCVKGSGASTEGFLAAEEWDGSRMSEFPITGGIREQTE